MKKFMTLFITICLCLVAAFGFVACSGGLANVTGGGQSSEGITPDEDISEPDTPSGGDQDDGGYMPPPEEGQEVPEGTQSSLSAAIAELTVPRLMTDHADRSRLVIRNRENGETVVSIPLIDAALLVKGYYNREMSDQEYLDRQDVFSMTFFLDEDDRWMDTYIYINSWKVVLQDAEL